MDLHRGRTTDAMSDAISQIRLATRFAMTVTSPGALEGAAPPRAGALPLLLERARPLPEIAPLAPVPGAESL